MVHNAFSSGTLWGGLPGSLLEAALHSYEAKQRFSAAMRGRIVCEDT
jgi:hypothetical protein